MRPGPALLACVLAVACRCPSASPPASTPSTLSTHDEAAWLEGREPDADAGPPRPGGTLVVRVPLEPAGLSRVHDGQVEGTMVRYTVGPLYETLGRVRRDAPAGPLEPLLATGWTTSDDGRALTVALRPGVRFHDGQVLSAADVVASVEVVRRAENPTVSFRAALGPLEAVEALDGGQVRFTWARPDVMGQRTLLAGLPVLPASALVGDFQALAVHRTPVGTGPFAFASWDRGQSLRYRRHAGYWGRPAWLDAVELRFVKDDAQAVQLWERGELDIMTRIPPPVWRGLEPDTPANRWARRGFRRLAWDEGTYLWIGWNTRRPGLSDSRVRQALARLFPMKAYLEVVELGLVRRTTCPYPRSSPSCDEAVEPLGESPEAARALLAQAGYADGDGDGVLEREGQRLQVQFLATAGSARVARLLPLMAEAFQRAGVALDVVTVDTAALFTRLRAHDFGATALAWSSQDAVDDLFPIFHSSAADGGRNYGAFHDARVDALLEQIRGTLDDDRRQALERQVHRLLYESQVYLFLATKPALDAVRREVHGPGPGPGWYELASLWVDRPR